MHPVWIPYLACEGGVVIGKCIIDVVSRGEIWCCFLLWRSHVFKEFWMVKQKGVQMRTSVREDSGINGKL
jgi:hypothetical protein